MYPITVYKREVLYEEVWTEPVSTVAKRYGVSDVALRKVCQKMDVPLPRRGYWAKIQAGHMPRRAKLPPSSSPTQIIRRIVQSTPRKTPLPSAADRLAFLPDHDRERVLKVCDSIVVRDRLVSPHPLIKQDRAAREEARREKREEERLRLHGGWLVSVPTTHPWKRMLEISVESEELSRAYRIMDAVFKAIESLGGSARLNQDKNHTEFVVNGEAMRCRLRSNDGSFHLLIDEYQAPRKNWRDGKRKRLESEVGSFVQGLYECAHAIRTLREERQREEERRCLLEQERRERAETKQEEFQKYQELENAAQDWHRARTLAAYVSELEQRALEEQDEGKKADMLAYVAWARQKVEWLDPLIAKEDPILGKRRHTRAHGEKVDLEKPYRSFW